MNIGLIAGESSGDLLGAGLIKSLRDGLDNPSFCGIAGSRMIAAGCNAWFPQEKLAVMGLFEVLKHLPELIKIRRGFLARCAEEPLDVFVGIDAPDFNLPVEERLKKRGIPTVHYVSPSVWAWRASRIKKIARATDLVLCILPFEKAFYDKHGLAASFVGHPLADQIPLETDTEKARQQLSIEPDTRVVAVLPGSRGGEMKLLGPDFVQTIKWLLTQDENLGFVAPMATPVLFAQFYALLKEAGLSNRVTLLNGQAQLAMAASDVVLLASGTATLEALLLKKPHVVAYRVSPATAWVVNKLKLMQVDRFALSNLLADEDLVPEFMQEAVDPVALGKAIFHQLEDKTSHDRLTSRFLSIHQELRQNADQKAAQAVIELLHSRGLV